jgi:hypothetical protein
MNDSVNENKFLRIMNRVQDTSNQISISFSGISFRSVLEFLNDLCPEIKRICLCQPPRALEETLLHSFSGFSNIVHLTLRNVTGIRKADLFLEKTRKLELHGCEFYTISSWNSKDSLETVIVHHCDRLTKFPCFENISDISIVDYNGVRACDFQVQRQKKLLFHGGCVSIATLAHVL